MLNKYHYVKIQQIIFCFLDLINQWDILQKSR